MNTTLTTDSQERKDIPLQRGCFDYFPAALAEVARLSLAGNEKHNPGEELHWARGKSMDHADCIARHQLERGTVDTDGFLHEVKSAWRALAQLQEALEARGAPMARGARAAVETCTIHEIVPPKKELAWNEGWKCKCGSTQLYSGYESEAHLLADFADAKRAGKREGPLCRSAMCFERMIRVV